MQTALLSKKEIVGLHLNQGYARILIFLISLLLIFIKVEVLFLILFSIGAPHVLFSLSRDYLRMNHEKNIFIISVLVNLLIAAILFTVSKNWFIYIVFFRFTLHFFEDREFNFNTFNLPLGLGISILYFSMDISLNNHLVLSCLSFIIIASHLALHRKQKPRNLFLNFYFLFPFLTLVPIAFKLKFNSASWSFNIGILHSILWIIYAGYDEKNNRLYNKNNILLTSLALLFVSYTAVWVDVLTYQRFYSLFFYVFYFLAFIHTFSGDQFFIIKKTRDYFYPGVLND